MRRMSWIAAVVVVGLACNYTEGQCWIDNEGEGSVGAGAGPIGPGWGGYGDVPPEPQDLGDPPPPDCNIAPDSPCNEKCLADYVATAEKCSEIKDAAQKRACDDNSYTVYKSCRETCAKAANDCLDQCKDLCVTIWEGCYDKCGKDHVCKEKCMQDLIACNEKCEEKCK